MSISEKDAVLRERAAFMQGIAYVRGGCAPVGIDAAEERSHRAYPLPKVTRPRVVTDKFGNHWRWTSVDGLQTSRPQGDGRWTQWCVPIGEPLRLMFADLLANPTEEVEE